MPCGLVGRIRHGSPPAGYHVLFCVHYIGMFPFLVHTLTKRLCLRDTLVKHIKQTPYLHINRPESKDLGDSHYSRHLAALQTGNATKKSCVRTHDQGLAIRSRSGRHNSPILEIVRDINENMLLVYLPIVDFTTLHL